MRFETSALRSLIEAKPLPPLEWRSDGESYLRATSAEGRFLVILPTSVTKASAKLHFANDVKDEKLYAFDSVDDAKAWCEDERAYYVMAKATPKKKKYPLGGWEAAPRENYDPEYAGSTPVERRKVASGWLVIRSAGDKWFAVYQHESPPSSIRVKGRWTSADEAKNVADFWEKKELGKLLKAASKKPPVAGLPTPTELAAWLKRQSTKAGGPMRNVRPSIKHPYPWDSHNGANGEPAYRQRLDHFVGKGYNPGPDEDPEGWDSEGWEEEYAGPIRQELSKALKSEFGKRVADAIQIDVGEKGHIYLNYRSGL